MAIIIKKFTKKTWFSVLSFLGIISAMFLRFIFGSSGVHLGQLENSAKNTLRNYASTMIPTASADTPHNPSGGDGPGGAGNGPAGTNDASGPSGGGTNGGGTGGNTGGGTRGGDGDSGSSGGDAPGSGGCVGDGCCFTHDQKVSIMDGVVEISQIKDGDIIVAYDEESDIFITSIVEHVIIHDGVNSFKHDFRKDALIELKIEIEGDINYSKVTENHPYYEPTTKEYKPIGKFNVGDIVKTMSGTGTILDKRIIINNESSDKEKELVVYDLHMKGAPHNYLVNGIVVHNKI
ncbi:MAG: Hint domain-containing protein [Candidatus Moraniibacteriota bacterium]